MTDPIATVREAKKIILAYAESVHECEAAKRLDAVVATLERQAQEIAALRSLSRQLFSALQDLYGIAEDEGVVGDDTTMPAAAAAIKAYMKQDAAIDAARAKEATNAG